jgi:hypothetical protein
MFARRLCGSGARQSVVSQARIRHTTPLTHHDNKQTNKVQASERVWPCRRLFGTRGRADDAKPDTNLCVREFVRKLFLKSIGRRPNRKSASGRARRGPIRRIGRDTDWRRASRLFVY